MHRLWIIVTFVFGLMLPVFAAAPASADNIDHIQATSAHDYDTPALGGSGGGHYSLACEFGNQFLAGIALYNESFLYSVQPICVMTRNGAWAEQPHGAGSWIGATTITQYGRYINVMCAKDSYVRGLAATRTSNPGPYVGNVIVKCGKPGRPASEDVEVSQHPTVSADNAGAQIPVACKTDAYWQYFAHGIQGRSGIYVDAIGLSCSGFAPASEVRSVWSGAARRMATEDDNSLSVETKRHLMERMAADKAAANDTSTYDRARALRNAAHNGHAANNADQAAPSNCNDNPHGQPCAPTLTNSFCRDHPNAQGCAAPSTNVNYRRPMIATLPPGVQSVRADPMVRLDWCLKIGVRCGQTPANAFCRSVDNGSHPRAVSFVQEANVSRTKTIGSGEVCDTENCVGFAQISCSQ